MSIIEKLAERGYPTTDIRAATNMVILKTKPAGADDTLIPVDDIRFDFADIFNTEHTFRSAKEAQATFRYAVSEAVRMNAEGLEVTTDAVMKVTAQRMATFWKKFPFLAPKEGETCENTSRSFEGVVTENDDGEGGVTFTVDKTAVKKKGGKQAAAMEIYRLHPDAKQSELVALFIKELGMTKAGATTYAYNCRKKWGNAQD